MKVLVTGSAGHLGEALVRTLKSTGLNVTGLDVKPSRFTDRVGSLCDRAFVRECAAGKDAIIHTATLHKPHVATHTRQEFIDTNVSGTLNLLEEAVGHGCRSFVYTSTTSTFGDAMKPAKGEPAVWVNEQLTPVPKNIYGVTKTAAEDLCHLFHRNTGLPCIVLRTSRFFPEPDDDAEQRNLFSDDNLKINELLFRRVDVADVVSAHQVAIRAADRLGFDKFIITANTPFKPSDTRQLGINAPAVLEQYYPDYTKEYARRQWKMFPAIGRVYDNSKARQRLGWEPRYGFDHALKCLAQDKDFRSPLTHSIGKKGYHDDEFDEGPYPVGCF